MIGIDDFGTVRTESVPDSFAFVDLQSMGADHAHKFVKHFKGLQ